MNANNKISTERFECILINAIERTIDKGNTCELIELIRDMEITSYELNSIGYTVYDFPLLHRAAGVKTIRAINIDWSVEEDEEEYLNDLPVSVEIPEDVEVPIIEWLSDNFGFLVNGFDLVCE